MEIFCFSCRKIFPYFTLEHLFDILYYKIHLFLFIKHMFRLYFVILYVIIRIYQFSGDDSYD
nr:MAG TPA: hypothetical protein [Caudoviricetes sp.]